MSTDAAAESDLREASRGWNWGAFLLNWIWGLGNRTPIALLCLIPVVGFVMMIVLGIKGNAWAWQNDTWKSVDHFRRTQRHWAIAGFIVWAAMIILFVGMVWAMLSLMKNNGAYELSMERLRVSPAITEAFGEPLEEGFMPFGSVEINGGTGSANLDISISGPKASGTAYSKAVLDAGAWRLTSLKVRVDGSEDLIVVIPDE